MIDGADEVTAGNITIGVTSVIVAMRSLSYVCTYVTSIVAYVVVNMCGIAQCCATVNVTSGIAIVVVNVLNITGIGTIFNVTIGVTCMIEHMVAGYSFVMASKYVTVGVARSVELVVGYSGKSTTFVTIGIAIVREYVSYVAYVVTAGNITVGIASIAELM